MGPRIGICGAVVSLSFVLACGDTPSPTGPGASAASAASEAVETGRRILMLDNCDPDSFNAALGAGTCVNRNGGLSFETFQAMFQRHQQVPSWRFSTSNIHVPRTMALAIINAGGEVHTFTEVADFGGGVVPPLNGGAPPRPECLALAPANFIASGAQTTHTFAAGESAKYQCCIHPWMRAEAR
jgi:hypothetical protein